MKFAKFVSALNPGHKWSKTFGESCKDLEAVGEGFGIMNGKFKIISGAFNPADDNYHDNSSRMNR